MKLEDLQKFKGIGDEWREVPVLDSNAIKALVVDAGTQSPAFLIHKK